MIYCVEDDKNIRELVVYAMKTGGFEATGFQDAENFYKAIKSEKPKLILLDIMLPGEDGLAILKKLKENKDTKELPVILLTAKGEEYDKVQGLDLGADDYVTKPFSVLELISRVKAVLRRCEGTSDESIITIGELSLNKERHMVRVEGEEIVLSYKEFELLAYLMQNQGIVLTRDKLLDTIWGYDYLGETRTVDMHIKNLRQKLGGCGDMIETVRGLGYRLGERDEA